jgi:hypothetical protein
MQGLNPYRAGRNIIVFPAVVTTEREGIISEPNLRIVLLQPGHSQNHGTINQLRYKKLNLFATVLGFQANFNVIGNYPTFGISIIEHFKSERFLKFLHGVTASSSLIRA